MKSKDLPLLHAFRTPPGLQAGGKVLRRDAVRAVVLRGDKILMVYSRATGDYKFPGGGVAEGETHPAALARELMEECGIRDFTAGEPVGRLVEYFTAREGASVVFVMTSYYYRGACGGEFGKQELEAYEREQGFEPRWVDLGSAIANNLALLEKNPPELPRWVARDTWMLEYLRDHQVKAR